MKATKTYYATQHPRGFGNEINIHRFSTRAARDAWVSDHCDDGDVNSASRGAYAATAAEVRRWIADKGDDLTQVYCTLINNCDQTFYGDDPWALSLRLGE